MMDRWEERSRYENRNRVLQGSTRRSYSSIDPYGETRSSQVLLEADRPHAPIQATVNYWDGPNNAPRKMRVYSEDGWARPIRGNFSNPRRSSYGYSSTVDIKNTGPLEFPMRADVTSSRQSVSETRPSYHSSSGDPFERSRNRLPRSSGPMQSVQGGSLKTFCFDPSVRQVLVELQTDGMPCNAKIEVAQGPGTSQQIYEVYSDDGSAWQGVVDLPGYGSTIFVKNTGPMEYPIKCVVEPVSVGGLDDAGYY